MVTQTMKAAIAACWGNVARCRIAVDAMTAAMVPGHRFVRALSVVTAKRRVTQPEIPGNAFRQPSVLATKGRAT